MPRIHADTHESDPIPTIPSQSHEPENVLHAVFEIGSTLRDNYAAAQETQGRLKQISAHLQQLCALLQQQIANETRR